MPTTRPRHQVTETPEIARALDLAARQWPGESRSALLRRLLLRGTESLHHASAEEMQRHRQRVMASRGKYTSTFEADHLDVLREDWPE